MLAAVLTGLAVYSYLSWFRAQIPVAGKLVSMVVASSDLPAGVVLEPSMLGRADHPEKYLPAGALTDPAPVLGRVLAVRVFEGEAITTRKVGETGGVSSIVPAGMRAYTFAVTSGLGVVPTPGDRVDVLVTLPREVLGEPSTIVSLRSKEVASVGTSSASSLGNVGDQLGLDENGSRGLSLTLFVTPEEAQKLAMAETLGRITVVLAPSEPEDTNPAPIRPSDLGK